MILINYSVVKRTSQLVALFKFAYFNVQKLVPKFYSYNYSHERSNYRVVIVKEKYSDSWKEK